MAVNPLTYNDVITAGQPGGVSVPNGVGTVWNTMTWEVYWNLITNEGFDTDFYSGTGGNNTAMQLIIDGMKMTACNPTFVDARDGILAADLATFGGAHACEIWTGFAKRGVGFSAIGGTPNVGDEVEAFDFPPGLEPDCMSEIFNDGFESGDVSAWSGQVPPP